MDQQAHAADHQQQHGGQRVDEEADLDLEVAGADPAVERSTWYSCPPKMTLANTIMLSTQPTATARVGTIQET